MMTDCSRDKKKQLEALENGKGIQYILNRAYEILGNPALVFDMDYKLIAAPDSAINDDPIWNEFMIFGKLSDETIEFCKNESFIDSVANSTKFGGVAYLVSDKLKYDRIFGQLYNKARMPVADLVIVACDVHFDDDTPELIKIICGVLSRELGKSEYYQDYGQAYQERIIKKLIDGGVEDRGIYSGHVSNVDRGLKTNIFVAVADIARCGPVSGGLVYFRDLFMRTQPAFKYFIYADYIVILISSDNTELDIKKDLHELNALLEKENIYAGISSGFENLYEMQKYYDEALNTLNHGLKSTGDKHTFCYADLKTE